LIAGVSAGLGAGLAVSINLWMVQGFAMTRLSPGYVLAGAVLVLLLGQVSVLWPALRAASIAPALATRGA
jgi:putative ABC transport system permease protein